MSRVEKISRISLAIGFWILMVEAGLAFAATVVEILANATAAVPPSPGKSGPGWLIGIVVFALGIPALFISSVIYLLAKPHTTSTKYVDRYWLGLVLVLPGNILFLLAVGYAPCCWLS